MKYLYVVSGQRIQVFIHSTLLFCGSRYLQNCPEPSNECRSCADKHRKIIYKIKWPPFQEILDRLKTTSYVQLGKELGVSDNAIRKRIKKMYKT